MSIENRLAHELKRQGESIHCPVIVRIQVEQLFDQRFSNKRSYDTRSSVKSRRRYSQALLVTLSILLFSGIAYASTLLYQMNAGNFSFSVSSNAQMNINSQEAQLIQEQMNQVRQQLAVGESALIYMPLLSQHKLPPLIKVTQPQAYTDLAEWRNQLDRGLSSSKLPDKLPEGFAFAEGRMELPVGGISPNELHDNLETLKKKANGSIAWHKITSSGSEPQALAEWKIPNLVYRNAKGEHIEIYYQLIPNSEKEKAIHVETQQMDQVDKMNLNGIDAYYSENKHSFLSPTCQSKALTWMGQENGRIVMYSVVSESVDVTKQDLVYMAEHMQ
jgi:hypothetical protein